jgi:hypothetical protein
MTAMLDVIHIAGQIERRLVARLALQGLALPPDLRALDGHWKGAPAVLEARAYRGAQTSFARFVQVHAADDVRIANGLVVPQHGSSLPIFGFDLVALGRRGALIVADLSPVWAAGDPRRSIDNERIRRRTEGMPPLPAAGELPPWARDWFSARAVFARVGAEQHADVVRALDQLVDACVEIANDVTNEDMADEGEIRARQRAYCAAHLEDDRGLIMLTRMFEPTRARRLLSEVMFPVEGPAWL